MEEKTAWNIKDNNKPSSNAILPRILRHKKHLGMDNTNSLLHNMAHVENETEYNDSNAPTRNDDLEQTIR